MTYWLRLSLICGLYLFLLVGSPTIGSSQVEQSPGVPSTKPADSGDVKKEPTTEKAKPKKSAPPLPPPPVRVEQDDTTGPAQNRTRPKDYYQKKDLDAQVRMAEATEDLIYLTKIELAFILLAFGVLLATIYYTHKTYRLVSKSSRAELRAYISLSPRTIVCHRNGRLEIEIVAKNCGKTPAYDVRTYGMIAECPYPLSDDFEPFDKAKFPDEKSVLQPGEKTWIREKSTQQFQREDFMALSVLDAMTGDGTKRARIFIFGYVSYVDTFGEERFTKLCASVPSSEILVIQNAGVGSPVIVAYEYYKDYNDAD